MIPLTQIAKEMGISYSYLSKCTTFKKNNPASMVIRAKVFLNYDSKLFLKKID